jgi:hypothetical protein
METGPAGPVYAGDLRRWTGRALMAVILGLGIWNPIASVIDNIVVPAMGTLMGQDGSLPASFTRNYDYPDVFVALLKFCVAGIVAVSLNWLFQRERKRWVRVAESVAAAPPIAAVAPAVPVRPAAPPAPVVRTAPAAPAPTRVLATMTPVVPVAPAPPRVEAPMARPAAAPVPSVAAVKPIPVATPVKQEAAVAPAALRPATVPVLAAPAKPAVKVEDKKPKKEKQIYYNLVGEPVEVDED